jgi:hypothetical protein
MLRGWVGSMILACLIGPLLVTLWLVCDGLAAWLRDR